MAFPTTSVLDSFTRANENPLAGGWSESAAWGETLKLVSNAITPDADTAGSYWTAGTFTNAIELYATVSTKAPVFTAFYLELTDNPATNAGGYRLEIVSVGGRDTWRLYRLLNNDVVALTPYVSQELHAGDSFGIRRHGYALAAYHKPSGGSWRTVLSTFDNYLSTVTAFYLQVAIENPSSALDDVGGGSGTDTETGNYDLPSLADIRRFTAALIGDYREGTATSGSSTSVLECTTRPFKSTISQDDMLKDQVVYIPTASIHTDRERVVASYTATTGLITPDLVWSTQQDSNPFEVHGVLSVEDAQNGMHALINHALKRCLIEEEITLTPVADQQRHSLATAAPWLSNPAWVYQVGYLTTDEDRDEVAPYRRVVHGQAVRIGGTVYLEHPGRTFNASTDTLYLKVLKPAYYACAAAATPATYTLKGLMSDQDICPVPLEWIGWATVVEILSRPGVAGIVRTAGDERVRNNLSAAAVMFSKYTRLNFAEPSRTLREIHSFGPRR